jgi:hypothetical protein
MSKKARFYVLLNHDLSAAQKEEIASLQMETVMLPQQLKALWRQVEVPVSEHIAPLIDYLRTHLTPQDTVFVQGHAGATYLVVEAVKALGAKAVYGHSPRINGGDSINDGGIIVSEKGYDHKHFWEYGV